MCVILTHVCVHVRASIRARASECVLLDHEYHRWSARIRAFKTKKEYNFGDKVQVLVQQVNPRKRQIDLELVPAP